MEPLQIFAELSEKGQLPAEAIQAARENRTAMTTLFLERIERLTSSDGMSPVSDDEADSLFMAFHLLGEWREKAAYRPLSRFLRLPSDTLDRIIGDSSTVTVHRVMAAVFDGDPAPLHEIIRDPQADEYIRKRMFDAVTMLTMNGDLPRAQTARFLEACFSELEPRHDCYAWQGWLDSIIWLRLAEMEPLVEQAFARGSIDPLWTRFSDFQRELQHGVAHPDEEPLHSDGELTLFGDSIEELQDWACFQPDRPRGALPEWPLFPEPERNPLRNVGRNDPCPCDSGKKFKKCCLNADRDAPPAVYSAA